MSKDICSRIQVRNSVSKHLEKKRNHYIKHNLRIDFPDDSDDCCSYIDDDEIEDYYNSLNNHDKIHIDGYGNLTDKIHIDGYGNLTDKNGNVVDDYGNIIDNIHIDEKDNISVDEKDNIRVDKD